MAPRLLTRREAFQAPAVHQEDIQPTIVVVIIETQATAASFQKIFVLSLAAIDGFHGQARFFDNIYETEAERGALNRRLWSRWSRRPLVWLQTTLPARRLCLSFPCGDIEPPGCNARPGRPDRSSAGLRTAPQPLRSHVADSMRFPIHAVGRGPADTGSPLSAGRPLPRHNVPRAFPPARDSKARARCSG